MYYVWNDILTKDFFFTVHQIRELRQEKGSDIFSQKGGQDLNLNNEPLIILPFTCKLSTVYSSEQYVFWNTNIFHWSELYWRILYRRFSRNINRINENMSMVQNPNPRALMN